MADATDWTTARDRLLEDLLARGAVTSAQVAAALRAVPRHYFLPDVPLQRAYADDALVIKVDRRGRPISSASQPAMVAEMLELLEVREGDRVLELGTATGYDAALLDHLVGEEGAVVTLEIEADLVATAREHLARAGCERVRTVLGDGKVGFAELAPYDRIIVTAGARRLEAAWADQLREGGRLVVPLVDERGLGAVVLFEKIGGELRRGTERSCAFVPLR